MLNNHQEILFGSQNNGERLFKTQSDLVSQLISTGEFGEKSKDGIKVFVNQVLNGKRNPSKSFESALKKVLIQKNNTEENVNQLYDDLVKSMTRKQVQEREKDGSDLEQLIERQDKAKYIYISTPEPAEIKNNKDADKLKKDLLEKIGVIETDNNRVNYIFFFPKNQNRNQNNIAFRFWKGLYDYAISTLDIPDIAERLMRANEGSNPFLKLFVVDEKFCWLPVVVLDPERDANALYSKEFAFIVIHYEVQTQQKISVAKFVGPSYEFWRQEFLQKIINLENQNPDNIYFEELKFRQVWEAVEINKNIL